VSTDPVDFLLRAALRLPRPAIERLAESLIDGLDRLDGDADLEPETDFCLAGDDGCGPTWRDGRRYWGSLHETEAGI
jgi:hypothetical protein